MVRSTVVTLAGAVSLFYAAGASAATITPNTTLDDNGSSSACSLREAIETANLDADTGGCKHKGTFGGDIVKVPGGEYHLTLTGGPEDANASGDLDVTNTLKIQGAGTDQTVIDANGAITGDRALDVPNSGTKLTLAGLTVRGGAGVAFGGGILADNAAKLSLENVAVTHNRASNFGGGIFGATGMITLTKSRVDDNSSPGGGAGVAGSAVKLTRTSVSHNTASGGGGAGGGINAATLTANHATIDDNSSTSFGGGVLTQIDATIRNSEIDGNASGDGGGLLGSNRSTIVKTTISENSATSFGGGMAGGPATITDSRITDNSSAGIAGGISGFVKMKRSMVSGNSAAGAGGGLNATGSIRESTIRGNSSDASGGGIATGTSGDLVLLSSTVAGNTAGGADNQGGGIYFNSSGKLTLTNSTIADNAATGWGGGISTQSGQGSTLDLNNATVTQNTADVDFNDVGDGGGIDQAPSDTVNLANSIVAGNQDSSQQVPDCNTNGGGLVSKNHNVFGSTDGCAVTLLSGDLDLAGANPHLGALAPNGGPTATVALSSKSPAVNAGSPKKPGSGDGACAASDQRGIKRSLGGRCDAGAYELVKKR